MTLALRQLRTSEFVAWYADRYVAAGDPVQVVRSRGVGEPLPSQPDRLVIVSRTGGPGLAREGAFDTPTYQIRWRGAQNDPDDAEALADMGDALLLEIPSPCFIAGRYIVKIDRTGSPPTELVRDQGRRTHLTASYAVQLSRY